MIWRRELITLLGGAAAWAVAARTQPAARDDLLPPAGHAMNPSARRPGDMQWN